MVLKEHLPCCGMLLYHKKIIHWCIGDTCNTKWLDSSCIVINIVTTQTFLKSFNWASVSALKKFYALIVSPTYSAVEISAPILQAAVSSSCQSFLLWCWKMSSANKESFISPISSYDLIKTQDASLHKSVIQILIDMDDIIACKNIDAEVSWCKYMHLADARHLLRIWHGSCTGLKVLHLNVGCELGGSLINVDYQGVFCHANPPREVLITQSCHEASQIIHSTVINVCLPDLHCSLKH